MRIGTYKEIEDIPPSFLRDRLMVVRDKYPVVKVRVAKDGICLTIKGKLSKKDIRNILKCITPNSIRVPRKLVYKKDYEESDFIDYGGTDDIEDATAIYSLDGIDYRTL